MSLLSNLRIAIPAIGSVNVADNNLRELLQSMKERIEKLTKGSDVLQSQIDTLTARIVALEKTQSEQENRRF